MDSSNPLKVLGTNSNLIYCTNLIDLAKFTSLSPKCTISLPKSAGEAIVSSIISDTELLINKPFEGEAAESLLNLVGENGQRTGTEFVVIPHVDQSEMFQAVINRLAKDQAVGIFPEGY